MLSRRVSALLFVLAFLGAFLTLSCLQLDHFADDPGVGWHLATGKQIAETHSIPSVDTFLSIQRPWISDQWLGDLFFYKIFQFGSWEALYVVGILLYISVFFLFITSLYISEGYSIISVLLGAFIGFKLGLVHFILRPVLLSFFLFSILWIILVRLSRTPKINRVLVIVLPLFFLVWANLHPSFVLGLSLVALLVLSLVIDKFLNVSEVSSNVTHHLLVVGILCVLGTIINPYWLELHQSILWLSHSDFFLTLHEEWRQLDALSPEGDVFRWEILLAFCGLFFFGRQKLRVTTFEFFAFLVFGALSLKSVRFVPYFAIVSTSFSVACLDSLIGIVTLRFQGARMAEAPRKFPGMKPLYFALSLTLILASLYVKGVPSYSGVYGPSKERFPYAAIDVLKSKNISQKDVILFNHPNWGGFITWYGGGRFLPVIDDRNTLVGEKNYRDFLETQRTDARIKDVALSAGARYVLLRKIDLQKQCHSLEGLNIIFEDDISVLAEIV